MPSPETILNGAASIANGWRTLAIGWHALLGTLVVALLIGWRPSNRFAGYLFTAPLLSVSALAWASGNPFNGAIFVALALLLIGLASRLSREPVNVASLLVLLPGALLVAFGWTYPHFLTAKDWTTYIYAAPFGLLPCPTLSAVIGLTLVLGMLRSKAWSMSLAVAGFVYGAIGVFKLGVALDYGLLAGAAVLGVIAGASRPGQAERRQESSVDGRDHRAAVRKDAAATSTFAQSTPFGFPASQEE
jgi:hypothetical protein